MNTTEELASAIPTAERTPEIRRNLRRVERTDWWLWLHAVVVILCLTAGIVSLSLNVRIEPKDPYFHVSLGQYVRGLVGFVLLLNICTLYQRFQLKGIRSRLAEQIEIAAQEHTRAEGLQVLAMLDPVTGLHNRRFAGERFAAGIGRAERQGSPLTVLLLDLNGFTQLNDRYGHPAGDAALKEFAQRLNRAIRGSDLAVRIGGDEFLVLLPECQLGRVQHVLGRLKDVVVELDTVRIPLTFSAGWADYNPGETPEELLKRADVALHVNKLSEKKHHPE